MNELKIALKNLRINHVFGMSGLMYVQPNINILTANDVIKAEKMVSDLCTRINWGIEIEKNNQNVVIISNAEKLSNEEQEKYFNEVYRHFNF